jgi:predicted dehydrogenase
LEHGVPVYTEKPPAVSLAAAVDVAKVADRTGVLCTTAFKKRYNTAYSRAKEWIDGFDTSDLFSISISYASGAYANDSDAKSFLLDFAIHCIDLAQYLFGDAAEVFCFSKGRDAYAVSVKFADGAVGSLDFNDGRSFIVPTEEVEISARGGNFLRVHNSSQWQMCSDGSPVEWREPPTFTSQGDSGHETGHLAEIDDFFHAVRDGRTTRSDIFASCRSMALYEAIKRSSETGEIVAPEYDIIPSGGEYPRRRGARTDG